MYLFIIDLEVVPARFASYLAQPYQNSTKALDLNAL